MNLTTINNYSLQEIFDFISNHLLTQNERSGDVGYRKMFSCKYKSSTGLKCAVGCLMSDEEYDVKLEGYGINSNKFNKFNISEDRKDLLRALQMIHDSIKPDSWKRELEMFAKNLHLEFKNIE